jgi:carboxymethylenebutenolidase
MFHNYRLARFEMADWLFPPARFLAALLALALLWVRASADTIGESSHSFKVADKTIGMSCLAPGGDEEHPAVLPLHGSEGLKDALTYRSIARILAENGYVALIVSYFDSTGTKRIEPKDINPKLFEAWLETVRQAVLHSTKLPRVDGRRIGLLGFSLGAYLSLAVATQADLPIIAVADFLGGLPKILTDRAKNLPPTLIIHGDADKTVPVQEALALEKLLQEHQRTYEKKVYAGQDHLFKRDLFGTEVRDAQDRTLAFFRKHLSSPPIVRRK